MKGFIFISLLIITGNINAETYRGLEISPEVNTPAYSRSQYKHWIDADNNDVNTRFEVLDEESWYLVTWDEKSNGDWFVVDGLWNCPYTGKSYTDPSDIDIDHMVPLKEVHQSGGHAWSNEKKQAYANDLNDPKTLVAVKDSSNQSKGHKDPAEWLPPNRAYWCEYLENWVSVKKNWNLTVDQAEVDALKEGFKVCKKYINGDKLEGRH